MVIWFLPPAVLQDFEKGVICYVGYFANCTKWLLLKNDTFTFMRFPD